MNWKIGEVEIFSIVELEFGKMLQAMIHGATPEVIRQIPWLVPHFADADGNLKAVVQSFLIKSDGKNILVDGCNGNHKIRQDIQEWANLNTDFLTQLNKLGISEKDINMVICTHLHCDHVGWNTKLENGNWIPTFPNAKYFFAKPEYDYWTTNPEKELGDDKAAFADSVKPIILAGRGQLVNADFKIDSNISLMATYGHTPGHVSLVIKSAGEQALISGDIMFHPCQIAYPEWTNSIDTFSDQATQTRLRILKEIADTNILLIGSHFPSPTAGKVKHLNDGYIFQVS